MTTCAITARWLIDGTGAPPIEDAVVLVEGDRIAAVGSRQAVTVPPGAERIDRGQETLLPGLIDAHTHPTIWPETRGLFGQMEGLAQPDSFQALRGASYLRADLLSGVTTAFSVGEERYNDASFKRAIAEGYIPGPRLFISGRPMTGSHGHGSPGWYVDGPEAIRRVVRENVKRGADFTKILLRDLTPTSATYTDEEVRAAVDETHRAGKKVHAHAAAGAHSLELALTNGVDSIAHATPVCERDLELYLETGAYVVRTFAVSTQTGIDLTRLTGKSIEARLRELDAMVKDYLEDPDKHSKWADYYGVGANARARAERIKQQVIPWLPKALQAGLYCACGTDGEHGMLPYEMISMVEWGVDPMTAIVCCTRRSAEAYGIDDRAGTLEPGKWADVISVRGNPLEDIWATARVGLIMQGGRRLDDRVSLL